MVVLSERSEPKDLSQMPNKPHIAPKLFRFTHFQKRVGGGGAGTSPSSCHSPLVMHHCFLLSPLYSALTRFPLLNSFRICTYKKCGGEGGVSSTSRSSL